MKIADVKVGVVVYYATENEYVRIGTKPNSAGDLYINNSSDCWAHVSELRKLTKRELGKPIARQRIKSGRTRQVTA